MLGGGRWGACCPPGDPAPTVLREAALHWAVPRSTLASAQQRHHRAWGPSLQVRAQSLSRVQLFVTHPTDCNPPGSTIHGILQARNWSWWPFPPPRDLPNPGIKPTFPASPALAGGFFITEPPGNTPVCRGFSQILSEERAKLKMWQEKRLSRKILIVIQITD